MQIELDNYTVFVNPELNDSGIFNTWFNNNIYNSIFVLTDENTLQHCYPLVNKLIPEHHVLTIKSGESHKNIETCKYLWQCLTDFQAERKSLLINIGGGVIGDMGGFVAGTYKRGFDFINMPTTLLAQVDASVGGKLGIDFNGVKNLIGLFKDPSAVFISPMFLSTLPMRQLKSGFGEVLKHGLIYNAAYWNSCKDIDLTADADWLDIIRTSVDIKKEVVKKDPFESGLRKILNFGHTIGHAVETWSLQNDETPLLHGEAIAIGMICEAWLSKEINGLPATELADITNTFIQIYGKYPLAAVPLNGLMEVMFLDKKNSNNTIRFSLLNSIGSCDFDIKATNEAIANSIKYYCELK